MKLGPRAGDFVLILATLLLALAMVLVGVDSGTQGSASVIEPEPAVITEATDDPDLGLPVKSAPPPQGNVSGQVPAEPATPAGEGPDDPPATTR